MKKAPHSGDVWKAHRADIVVVEWLADFVGECMGVESTSNAAAGLDHLEGYIKIQEDEGCIQATRSYTISVSVVSDNDWIDIHLRL